jgi:hypothetical protein
MEVRILGKKENTTGSIFHTSFMTQEVHWQLHFIFDINYENIKEYLKLEILDIMPTRISEIIAHTGNTNPVSDFLTSSFNLSLKKSSIQTTIKIAIYGCPAVGYSTSLIFVTVIPDPPPQQANYSRMRTMISQWLM